MDSLWRRALTSGINHNDFWDMTLTEVILSLKANNRTDEVAWNHTASLMALFANSKARKGKSFSPEQFHPYLKAVDDTPKTKEDVDALIEKMKKFNG